MSLPEALCPVNIYSSQELALPYGSSYSKESGLSLRWLGQIELSLDLFKVSRLVINKLISQWPSSVAFRDLIGSATSNNFVTISTFPTILTHCWILKLWIAYGYATGQPG